MVHDLVDWRGQNCEDHACDIETDGHNVVEGERAAAMKGASVVHAQLVDAAGDGCECKKKGGSFHVHANAADGCQCLRVAVPESYEEEDKSNPC